VPPRAGNLHPRKTALPAGQKTVRGHSIAPKNANVIRRLIFTPAALAYARHRYEKTEASLVDIAVDLQVTKNTVRNLAKSEGWTRYVPPARNLPPGVATDGASRQRRGANIKHCRGKKPGFR
jgi:hypothetical protein